MFRPFLFIYIFFFLSILRIMIYLFFIINIVIIESFQLELDISATVETSKLLIMIYDLTKMQVNN